MTDKPRRIQRRRTKGWRMPEGAIYVGRPTKWGNPHNWKDAPDDMESRYARGCAVDLFREDVKKKIAADPAFLGEIKAELGGKILVCWCPLDQPCHADIWLRLANS